MSEEMMLHVLERLRVTVRDLWHDRGAGSPGTRGSVTIRDTEIAARSEVDLDTERAFLVSETGNGLVIASDGGAVSVEDVATGYGE